MKLKKLIASLLSISLMSCSCGLSISADVQNNGGYKIVNAPKNAEFNIYEDVNHNYIYDVDDVLIGSMSCDIDGIGNFENLESGDYIAVLQNDYPNVYGEYAFTSDGNSVFTQKVYASSSSDLGFNTVQSSSNSVNISYDVPLFKQSDSRWGDLIINNSGCTMKDMGCVITSFAMLRSYEVGYDILPSQMMKTYSTSTGVGVVYSSGTSMIIPTSASNYNWNVYGSTSWYGGNGEIANNQVTTQALLKYVYEKLNNGPVILGGYSTPDARGNSNHWIVINGYHGDGVNFYASDFSICDPGANRTNLGEFTNKYLYWDRIIYSLNNKVTSSSISSSTQEVSNLSSQDVLNLGDVNCDGKMNVVDCFIIRKYLLHEDMSDYNFSFSNGDVNYDNILNIRDLVIIKEKILNGKSF